MIDRSAAGSTVVVALAELLAGTGSTVVDGDGRLVGDLPVDLGRDRDRDGPRSAPFAIVPSEHVTVPLDCEHVPCEGVAELKVTPAGSVSVTVTPVALDGPALATPSV